MRSAVFCRYWSTGGGAEKYGGVIAQHLSQRGEVDLLAYEPVDLRWLEERLQLDLSGVRLHLLEDAAGALTEASKDYDWFVNVSFMSHEAAGHARSLYVVHFPTALQPELPPWRRMVAAGVQRVLPPAAAPLDMSWGEGFHHGDGGFRGVTWTTDAATLLVEVEEGQELDVELLFAHQRPVAAGPCHVTIDVGGVPATQVVLEAPANRLAGRIGVPARFRVRGRGAGESIPITIRAAETFVPRDLLGTDDARVLGAPLKAIRFGRGPAARAAAAIAAPSLTVPSASSQWIESYGAIVSNSVFTQEWVTRRWNVESSVLYPPVTLQQAGPKEPIILNVGRFFAADQGHSKKQIEMVRAFRTLVDDGVRGWTLHLVGGCAADGEGYLAEVQHLAEGYPVEVHANAPGAVLKDLYARASIYWHASGLGEDVRRHPDRLEHFGITTVEAMSAGAVPIVVGLAGQLETVRHGIDGYHFQRPEDLAALTQMVIDSPAELDRLRRSARERAQSFAVDAFTRRLDEILSSLEGGVSVGSEESLP